MCQFFSVISDGKGKTRYFSVKDIAQIMSEGNPKNYNWNSHTSIADFYGIEEDEWNKWEYDPKEDSLKKDSLVVANDNDKVIAICRKIFKGKNIDWLLNFYNRNTGNSNTGNSNTGYNNTGNSNTGNSNTGNSNTGNSNTGNRNTGYSNTGDRNCGWFNTDEPKARFFNKPSKITLTVFYNSDKCPNINLNLIVWIDEGKMTDEEKTNNPNYATIGGYLKVMSYKDAWAEFWVKTDEANKKKILALPNFSAKIFKEITGIDIKKTTY